jgi:hypothetical protein
LCICRSLACGRSLLISVGLDSCTYLVYEVGTSAFGRVRLLTDRQSRSRSFDIIKAAFSRANLVAYAFITCKRGATTLSLDQSPGPQFDSFLLLLGVRRSAVALAAGHEGDCYDAAEIGGVVLLHKHVCGGRSARSAQPAGGLVIHRAGTCSTHAGSSQDFVHIVTAIHDPGFTQSCLHNLPARYNTGRLDSCALRVVGAQHLDIS